jgi:hypothetical protein
VVRADAAVFDVAIRDPERQRQLRHGVLSAAWARAGLMLSVAGLLAVWGYDYRRKNRTDLLATIGPCP